MIPCTDFIPAYSEMFKFLEKLGGVQAVDNYWAYYSDNFLGNLKSLVEEKGIRGCWEYWNHTLNKEAADFTMELDVEAGVFKIIMHKCPSKSRLNQYSHIVPYHDYCRHCAVLYPRVLEPLGYECLCDLSKCDQAKCSFIVKKKNKE